MRNDDVARLPYILLIFIGLLAACQPMPSAPVQSPELPPLPALPVADAQHFVVSPERSTLHVLVQREGPLAKYGHNHVVSAPLRGDVYLRPEFQRSGFALSLAVNELVVDDPAARAAEGGDFAGTLSAQAIAATRDNMLSDAVLNATAFSRIGIRSVSLSGPEWQPDISLRIQLRGVERDIRVPTVIERCGDALIASGRFTLRQSDFGIEPFSVLGGGLRVSDALVIRFRIVAERADQ